MVELYQLPDVVYRFRNQLDGKIKLVKPLTCLCNVATHLAQLQVPWKNNYSNNLLNLRNKFTQ